MKIAKKPTQYDQVIAVVKKFGKKGGSASEIIKAIPKLKNWGAKNPAASVRMYLIQSNEIEKIGKIYRYKKVQRQIIKKGISTAIANVVYLITVSDCIKSHFNGFPFKVGKADKDLKGRLKGYNQSLPFETIKFICYYPIPSNIKAIDIEKQVIQKMRNLGKDNYLGLEIKSLLGGNQEDWFFAPNLRPDNKDHTDRLSEIVGKIVKQTVDNSLRKKN